MTYKLASELKKMHSMGMIHNDMKKGNVLFSNPQGDDHAIYELEIIDYDLADFVYTGKATNLKKGTKCFYAPEKQLRYMYESPAVDVWAYGMIFFQLLNNGGKIYRLQCKDGDL